MQKQSLNTESIKLQRRIEAKSFMLLLALALFFPSCSGNKTNSNTGSNATPTATPAPTSSQTKFSIDGDRAFEHVRKQVEIGPRAAGSAELAKARDYIVGELKSYGLNVTLDEFTSKTPVGDRKMVKQLKEKNDLKRVRAMILLDMIGYKNLRLGRDVEMSTPWLIDEVWQTARDLGYSKQFVDEEEGVGGDDHEPFLKEGIQSLDIIQLSTYEYWHKPEDTLDKISPQSLKIVGDVVLNSLPRIEQRLLKTRT